MRRCRRADPTGSNRFRTPPSLQPPTRGQSSPAVPGRPPGLFAGGKGIRLVRELGVLVAHLHVVGLGLHHCGIKLVAAGRRECGVPDLPLGDDILFQCVVPPAGLAVGGIEQLLGDDELRRTSFQRTGLSLLSNIGFARRADERGDLGRRLALPGQHPGLVVQLLGVPCLVIDRLFQLRPLQGRERHRV